MKKLANKIPYCYNNEQLKHSIMLKKLFYKYHGDIIGRTGLLYCAPQSFVYVIDIQDHNLSAADTLRVEPMSGEKKTCLTADQCRQ